MPSPKGTRAANEHWKEEGLSKRKGGGGAKETEEITAVELKITRGAKITGDRGKKTVSLKTRKRKQSDIWGVHADEDRNSHRL